MNTVSQCVDDAIFRELSRGQRALGLSALADIAYRVAVHRTSQRFEPAERRECYFGCRSIHRRGLDYGAAFG